MTNRSLKKGTKAETAVVDYLRGEHWPLAERRAKNGNRDRGDIAGLGVVIEVKDCVRLDLAGWLAELKVEMANDNARWGAVIHKKRGTTNVADWYVTLPGHVFADMLKEAQR